MRLHITGNKWLSLAILIASQFLVFKSYASVVELFNVSYFPNGGVANQETRIYTLAIGNNPKYAATMRAERAHDEWLLSLTLDKSSPIPLNVPDKELIGDGGALFQFLDRFFQDEPGARVILVGIELRASSALWQGFEQHMIAFSNETPGRYTDPDATLPKIEGIMSDFIAKSRDAKELGKLVAERCGCKVVRVDYGKENGLDRKLLGRNFVDLKDKLNFGLVNPPLLEIMLKSKGKT